MAVPDKPPDQAMTNQAMTNQATTNQANVDQAQDAANAPGSGSVGGPGKPAASPLPTEIGGAPGPEPTRYGDWQHKGRVTDF